MAGTIGVFDCRAHGGKGDPKFPTSPVIKICLQTWSTPEDGTITLTPDLMTPQEIDTQIGLMKADLEAVGRKAKAALTARLP